MIDLAERPSVAPERLLPEPAVDERPARRALQAQIARLERELARLLADCWPRQGFDFAVGHRSGRPHLLDLGELEQIRDALADRIAAVRDDLAERRAAEDANRRLIADMLRHPERHRWERVSNADIGEPGCHHWHVVPRWGPIGILTNWWRVKISSGCP